MVISADVLGAICREKVFEKKTSERNLERSFQKVYCFHSSKMREDLNSEPNLIFIRVDTVIFTVNWAGIRCA